MYSEMAFISYYFHWSDASVLDMEHNVRRKWCKEISDINRSLQPSDKHKEKNIFELKPTR